MVIAGGMGFLERKAITFAAATICMVSGIGCANPEIEDYGGFCLSAVARDEGFLLIVNADSMDCASDHKRARFECEVERVDEGEIVVTTLFQDGKDPDDSCNGPLTTTCEVLLPDGEYTVHFAGESLAIAFPLEPETCLPEGFGTTG